MKKVSIILLTALICMLCSCGQNTIIEQNMADVNTADNEQQTFLEASENFDEDYPLYRLSEHTYSDETFVKASKVEYSDDYSESMDYRDYYSQEELTIIDNRYDQLLQQYPEYADISRSMLREGYSIYDGSESVFFDFCLGGYKTECRFEFKTTPDYQDGHWFIDENSFSSFYQSGMTESNVSDIKQLLAQQIQSQIDQYKLEKNNNLSENIRIEWSDLDGKCCACTEYIANVTSDTTESFGCGDHAHLNAMVYID